MSDTEIPKMSNDLTKELKDGLVNHLVSANYSDFTIRCKSYEQKVHRLVLCSQSKFFDKACNSEFKIGTTDALELDHEHPAVVEAMIHGMYKLDYQDNDQDFAEGETSPLLFNTAVYAIAAMYDIPALKRLAAIKFETFATQHWNEQCFTIFSIAVRDIYESTVSSDRLLRDVAVKIAARNMGVLFETDCGFDSMTAKVGEFSRDLAHCVGGKQWKTRFLCPRCQQTWEGYTFEGSKALCGKCGEFPTDWHKHTFLNGEW